MRQGTRVDDFRDEDPGPDPARDALRRADRVRGAAALAVLRLRRRDAAVRRPARRVRALDRRPQARPRARARGARRARTGSTSTPTCRATATSAYQRRNEETGLENQCWKDSWDSISYRDGRLPGFPRATCELQGYAYDAKMRGARLARLVWKRPGPRRPARAARRPTSSGASTATSGSRTAATSRSRSTPTASQVDALTSNNGHLLWSGIVDKSKAKARRRATCWAAALLRLGRPHARRGRGPLQPDRLPRRHGLAVRQLVHRLGAAPLRVQGRSGAGRRRGSSTRPSSSTAGSRRRSAATTGR